MAHYRKMTSSAKPEVYNCRNTARRGPNHGHILHAHQSSDLWFLRYVCGQTDKHTHSSQYSVTLRGSETKTVNIIDSIVWTCCGFVVRLSAKKSGNPGGMQGEVNAKIVVWFLRYARGHTDKQTLYFNTS